MSFGTGDRVLGAEVEVVVFDVVGAMFLDVRHSPARGDLSSLVAIGQPYTADVVTAYPVVAIHFLRMERERVWHQEVSPFHWGHRKLVEGGWIYGNADDVWFRRSLRDEDQTYDGRFSRSS